MKKLIVISFLLALVTNLNAQNLISKTSFDQIKKTTKYEDLKTLYGAKNLKEDTEYAAEGTITLKVTKIFKGTSKEIVVVWTKGKLHKQINYVEVTAKGSPYKTAEGIKVGTTMEELVKANGKRINFGGTGWDYGGQIVDYNKGKLEKAVNDFTLDSNGDLSDKLVGEVALNTDMPLVKKNLKKWFVARIVVGLND